MVSLGEPCLLPGEGAASPERLIGAPDRFDCTAGISRKRVQSTWALFPKTLVPPVEHDRWVFRHRYARADSTRVWFRFDDGTILPSPTTPAAARQALASADLVFDVPRHPAAVNAVLMRIDRMQNAHGVAPDAHIEAASSLSARASGYRLFYGLYIGMLFVTLVYALMVHGVLRHRFLLAYAAFTASMMAFGLSWGGGFFPIFPALTPIGQVQMNFIAVALAMATSTWFLTCFLEADMMPPRLRHRMLSFAMIPLGLVLLRMPVFDWQWRALDLLLYAGFACTLLANLALAIHAVRRGSRAARILVLSWSLPALVAFARMAWAAGLIIWHHAAFDLAIFMSILVEIVVMTAGVAWRIGELRAERDDARAREMALSRLADTDAMTGLLNRRLFMDRSMEGEHAKRLILITVDRFRSINERHGHRMGDEILARIARCLRSTAPSSALVGRLGGAEFAIALNASDSARLAGQLRKRIDALSWPGGVRLSIQSGSALGQIVDDLSWKTVYSAADRAMQATRQAGRKREADRSVAIAA